MEHWQYIYTHFDPVAFSFFSLQVHWYGLMYVLALLTSYLFARWLVKNDRLPMTLPQLDAYFIWVEVGVILGARLGYVLFYDPQAWYYLSHPWQIFNPYQNGEFVGIRGMSYHGALAGFLITSYIYARRNRFAFWFLMDLVAISVPVGYIFGRIGNFLNQELFGRITEVPWGIYVAGMLRHPSQLYEAVLEGIVVFLVLFFYRTRARFAGELAVLYGVLYGIARFAAEFWRQPDPQLGFICCGWLTMGQALSLVMVAIAIAIYPFIRKQAVPHWR